MPVNPRHLCLALLVCTTLGGCATANEKGTVWVSDLPSTETPAEPVIHPRDTIAVIVKDQPAVSGEFVVREEGAFLLPTVGEVSVGGKTLSQVNAELRARLAPMFVNPSVTVSITQSAPIRVNVVGEVKTPASVELTRDRSVAAALAAAGWLTEFADRDRIYVVRRDLDRRVRFRARDITAPDPAVARFRLSDGDVVVVE
jgi:polysaccharide export outer membrane protein